MVVSTPEKDRALEDLHRIPDRLDRLNDTLDRIADALEDIAIEAKRPHEAAMEQQRRQREAAAGRAYGSISSERGRGE